MFVIAMAGLPASGKSTLARAFARELHVPVFDKDRVRAALFDPSHVEYSREQDDLCCRLTYEAAEFIAQRAKHVGAILDGRTYSKCYQVEALEALARKLDAVLCVIECRCSEASARARLASDPVHPAADRTFERFLALRATAEKIEIETFVVETDRGDLVQHFEACLDYVRGRISRV